MVYAFNETYLCNILFSKLRNATPFRENATPEEFRRTPIRCSETAFRQGLGGMRLAEVVNMKNKSLRMCYQSVF